MSIFTRLMTAGGFVSQDEATQASPAKIGFFCSYGEDYNNTMFYATQDLPEGLTPDENWSFGDLEDDEQIIQIKQNIFSLADSETQAGVFQQFAQQIGKDPSNYKKYTGRESGIWALWQSVVNPEDETDTIRIIPGAAGNGGFWDVTIEA